MKIRHNTAKADYTAAMLPQSRKAIFFDVLQLHWQKLLLLGLILLLFYLPLLLSTAAKDIYISNLYAALEGAADPQISQAGISLMQLDILRNIIHILFILIFAVAFSGVMRTVRQYAWMENVHIPTDFGKGIRDNFRQTAAIGSLSGVIYVLCLAIYYSASSYSTDLLAAASLLPIAISLFFVLPVFAIAIAMVPIYDNRLWTTLKNAFFVYSRTVFRNILTLCCCLAPWIISLLPNFYCHIFGSVFAVLLIPFALLAWYLYCYEQFDQHLNPVVCPELIGKGIHMKTDAGRS